MNDKEIQQMIEQVGYSEFYRYYKEKDIRIEQLQSNWNSLREDLKRYDLTYLHETGEHQLADAIEGILDKMNELEGKKIMIQQLNNLVSYFIDNIDKDIVIMTDKEHFILFDDKEKGIDLELQLNTYKGYPVILRDDMPPNNEFIIMTKRDYLRLEGVNNENNS